MHLVNKTAHPYPYFLAQEQQEFLQLPLKLIIDVFNLILEFKSSKLDRSKDNNIICAMSDLGNSPGKNGKKNDCHNSCYIKQQIHPKNGHKSLQFQRLRLRSLEVI